MSKRMNLAKDQRKRAQTGAKFDSFEIKAVYRHTSKGLSIGIILVFKHGNIKNQSKRR